MKQDHKKNEKKEMFTGKTVQEDKEQPIRILLAEDNPVSQKLLQTLLAHAGYHVEVVNNGKEAIAKYTASPENFDLIFIDLMMPEMDGIETTKWIREKKFQSIPIVAITAHESKYAKDECIKVGINDFLSKPIRKEQVLEIIKKWVLKKKV